MTEVAQSAALVLAVIFGWAAVAKLRDRSAVVASLGGLGLPAPAALAVGLPAAEVLLAAALVVAPAPASWISLGLLLAFSLVIGRAVVTGASIGCACFGGGAEARPVSTLELVRNGGLGALAVIATDAGGGTALWPSVPALVIVTALVAFTRAVFAVVELRRAAR